uniref:Uncharacterized protein n=1 Tax=Anguilla anguilla TaxID=7936 RepID=A0A0E9X8Z8_ANGAN
MLYPSSFTTLFYCASRILYKCLECASLSFQIQCGDCETQLVYKRGRALVI